MDSTHIGQKAIDVEANQLFSSCNKSQKVIEAETIPSKVISLASKDQKVVDAKSCKSVINTSKSWKIFNTESRIIDVINTSRGQKLVNTEFCIEIMIKKSYISQIIKLFAKAQDIIRKSRE